MNRATVLVLALLALASPASAQWRLLRGIARHADDAGSVSRRARAALDHAPDGGRRAYVAAEEGGFRLFSPDGAPEGRSLGGREDLARWIEGAVDPVDLLLDAATVDADLVDWLADEGVEVAVAVDDTTALPLHTVEVEGRARAYAAVTPRLWLEVDGAEVFFALHDVLAEQVVGSDVARIEVTRPPAREELTREIRSRGRHPVLFHGALADGLPVLAEGPPLTPGDWRRMGKQHDGALVALAFPNVPEANREHALQAATITEFLERLTPRDGSLLIEALTDDQPGFLDAESTSCLIAARGRTANGEVGDIRVAIAGAHPIGLVDPVPLWLQLILMLGMQCLVARPVGELLSWPLRYEPTRWRFVKLTALGVVPFVPFGEEGALAQIVCGVALLTCEGVGAVVARILGFTPERWPRAKHGLLGLAAIGGLVAFVQLLMWI